MLTVSPTLLKCFALIQWSWPRQLSKTLKPWSNDENSWWKSSVERRTVGVSSKVPWPTMLRLISTGSKTASNSWRTRSRTWQRTIRNGQNARPGCNPRKDRSCDFHCSVGLSTGVRAAQSQRDCRVAPFNRDSGRYSGKRRIWGGRAEIRSLLYMATVVAIRYNPPLRAYYQHLREKGKLKKVAIVACMRKLLTCLNAMMRDNTPWQDDQVSAFFQPADD
jgi:hypothetical protein